MKWWYCLNPNCGWEMMARKRPYCCPACGVVSGGPEPKEAVK